MNPPNRCEINHNNNNSSLQNQNGFPPLSNADAEKVETVKYVLATLDSELDCAAIGDTVLMEAVTLEAVQVALRTSSEIQNQLITNRILKVTIAGINQMMPFFERMLTATPLILRNLNLTHIRQVGEGIPLDQSALWYALCHDADFLDSRIRALDEVEARHRELERKYSKNVKHPEMVEATQEKGLLWGTIEHRLSELRAHGNISQKAARSSYHLTIKDILQATATEIEKIGCRLTMAACQFIRPEVTAQIDLAKFVSNSDNDDDDDDVNSFAEQKEVHAYLEKQIRSAKTLVHSANGGSSSGGNRDGQAGRPLSLQRANELIEEAIYTAGKNTPWDSVGITVKNNEINVVIDDEYIYNDTPLVAHCFESYPDHFLFTLDVEKLSQFEVDDLFHNWKFDGESDFIPVKHQGHLCYKYTWKNVDKPYRILMDDPVKPESVEIRNGERYIKKKLVDKVFTEAKRRLELIGDEKYAIMLSLFKLAPELNQDTLSKAT